MVPGVVNKLLYHLIDKRLLTLTQVRKILGQLAISLTELDENLLGMFGIEEFDRCKVASAFDRSFQIVGHVTRHRPKIVSYNQHSLKRFPVALAKRIGQFGLSLILIGA